MTPPMEPSHEEKIARDLRFELIKPLYSGHQTDGKQAFRGLNLFQNIGSALTEEQITGEPESADTRKTTEKITKYVEHVLLSATEQFFVAQLVPKDQELKWKQLDSVPTRGESSNPQLSPIFLVQPCQVASLAIVGLFARKGMVAITEPGGTEVGYYPMMSAQPNISAKSVHSERELASHLQATLMTTEREKYTVGLHSVSLFAYSSSSRDPNEDRGLPIVPMEQPELAHFLKLADGAQATQLRMKDVQGAFAILLPEVKMEELMDRCLPQKFKQTKNGLGSLMEEDEPLIGLYALIAAMQAKYNGLSGVKDWIRLLKDLVGDTPLSDLCIKSTSDLHFLVMLLFSSRVTCNLACHDGYTRVTSTINALLGRMPPTEVSHLTDPCDSLQGRKLCDSIDLHSLTRACSLQILTVGCDLNKKEVLTTLHQSGNLIQKDYSAANNTSIADLMMAMLNRLARHKDMDLAALLRPPSEMTNKFTSELKLQRTKVLQHMLEYHRQNKHVEAIFYEQYINQYGKENLEKHINPKSFGKLFEWDFSSITCKDPNFVVSLVTMLFMIGSDGRVQNEQLCRQLIKNGGRGGSLRSEYTKRIDGGATKQNSGLCLIPGGNTEVMVCRKACQSAFGGIFVPFSNVVRKILCKHSEGGADRGTPKALFYHLCRFRILTDKATMELALSIGPNIPLPSCFSEKRDQFSRFVNVEDNMVRFAQIVAYSCWFERNNNSKDPPSVVKFSPDIMNCLRSDCPSAGLPEQLLFQTSSPSCDGLVSLQGVLNHLFVEAEQDEALSCRIEAMLLGEDFRLFWKLKPKHRKRKRDDTNPETNPAAFEDVRKDDDGFESFGLEDGLSVKENMLPPGSEDNHHNCSDNDETPLSELVNETAQIKDVIKDVMERTKGGEKVISTHLDQQTKELTEKNIALAENIKQLQEQLQEQHDAFFAKDIDLKKKNTTLAESIKRLKQEAKDLDVENLNLRDHNKELHQKSRNLDCQSEKEFCAGSSAPDFTLLIKKVADNLRVESRGAIFYRLIQDVGDVVNKDALRHPAVSLKTLGAILEIATKLLSTSDGETQQEDDLHSALGQYVAGQIHNFPGANAKGDHKISNVAQHGYSTPRHKSHVPDTNNANKVTTSISKSRGGSTNTKESTSALRERRRHELQQQQQSPRRRTPTTTGCSRASARSDQERSSGTTLAGYQELSPSNSGIAKKLYSQYD